MKNVSRIRSLIKRLDDCEEPLKPDVAEKLQTKLFSLIDQNVPDCLFRYRPGSAKDIDCLKRDCSYLSLPERFNDPADCMVYVNPEEILELSLRHMAPKGYEDAEIDETGFPTGFMKSLEIANYGLDLIGDIKSGVKVCCLSENIKSPLMWSHYARDHKGFALQYEMKDFLNNDCDGCKENCFRKGRSFFPVIYNEQRSNNTAYAFARSLYASDGHDDSDLPIPLLPLIQKGADWKYEKEWRYICRNMEVKYITIKPRAIYLGYAMEQETREQIIAIAKEKEIDIFEVFIDFLDPLFQMTIREYIDTE